ncbi:glutamate-rich protein 3-like [Athene cunicularia]|uniref:glutamate-rich protein 3-like n=1 Tax=Athene cunicularia TaxID=194338 RepID=UPI000EF742B3|nr:glutamate-rich protein 3-like [Athene cunicularia]
MSHPPPRLLETYNSLKDKNLTEYFNNTWMRQHLQRSGLISRSGKIIPEKEYRLNAIREERQSRVRKCLAGTMFNEAPDTERHHHPGAEKKRAENGRKEKAQKVKVRLECSRVLWGCGSFSLG